jgi:hypothetical protein
LYCLKNALNAGFVRPEFKAFFFVSVKFGVCHGAGENTEKIRQRRGLEVSGFPVFRLLE